MVGEFPESMNHTADQWLNNIGSGEKKNRGTFRRLMARPFFVLCWITGGIAFILLGIFLFYPHRNTPMSLLSDLKAGPKVFRTKIPEEILIAQNFFRGKFPVVNQPVKIPTKIESLPPVEKKEQSVSSQPAVVPSKQRQLPGKTDLRLAEVRPQPVKEEIIEKTETRIIHGEKWLLSQVSSYYTIQLMGARKDALLFNFVERNQLLEQNEIAFYQSTFEDKVWFQLLYGVYVTKKDAQAAADNLPLKIRKSSPWIRRLSAVQKAIRRKAAQ